MNKNVMKKIAIYIDTSSLINGKVYGLEAPIDELIKLLDNHKENLILLNNDILEEEIYRNIELVNFPESKLEKCFNQVQIEDVKRIFEDNKTKYLGKINKLFKLAEKINLKISNDEIMDGVKRQYDKEPPWSKKNGKPNEWKDFFVQKSLVGYLEKDDLCNELIILCDDEDFDYLKKKALMIDVRATRLNEFIEYLNEYLVNGKESFKNYLINKIYLDLGQKIQTEIEYVMYSDGIYLSDLEIYIESIKVIDANDRDNIHCEMEVDISGIDLTNAQYDKEDGRYYNEEYFESKERYGLYVSINKKQATSIRDSNCDNDNVVDLVEIIRNETL